MRKYLSVMMLAARGVTGKLVGIAAALVLAEGAVFCLALRGAGEAASLDQLIESSRVPWIGAACFLALCAALSLTGCEFSGSRVRYTLQRLRVSERTATFLFAAVNLCCLLVLWAVQTAAALLLCDAFAAAGAGRFANEQTAFLAFYRSSFLHSLLPLAEGSRWARNGIVAVCLSLAAACFSHGQRHGRKPVAVAVLAGMTAVGFAQPMGSAGSDAALSLLALAVMVPPVLRLWKEDADEA